MIFELSITVNLKMSEDKFYTKPDTVTVLLQQVQYSNYDLIVEPSAGCGNISIRIQDDLIKSNLPIPIIAYDIQPEHQQIQTFDFLNQISPEMLQSKNCLIVGNPPFGAQASLAIKFFNRAASYTSVKTIAFIVPKSFRKPSIQDRLANTFLLGSELDIQENSFTLNNQDHSVPCIIQVWHRSRIIRLPFPKEKENQLYRFTEPQLNVIAIRRVGGTAGRSQNVIDQIPSPESHYFITSDTIPKEYIVEHLNKIQWKHNNTVGPKSISKQEFITELNQITKSYLTR